MDKKIIQIKKYILQNHYSNNHKNIKRLIRSKPVNVIIEALENIDNIKITKYLLIQAIFKKNNLIGKYFDALSYDMKVEIISISNSKLIREIFDDLEINLAHDFIEEISQTLKKRILISISQETRKEIIKLAKYDESEIGQIMNPFFLKCYLGWTIAEASQYLSNNREEISLNGSIFVVDEEKKLHGVIKVHDILLEKDKNKLIDLIIDKTVVTISIEDEIEDAILSFQKYDLASIPVINPNNKVVGVINDVDIIAAIEEEATDDIYKMYGIAELTQPYIRTRVLTIVKSRIFWLILLMLVSTLTSAAIDIFTQIGLNVTGGLSTIFLIPLIPVITGASGNAGSQSAASLIRSLSIGEISKKDYKKVLWKEFNVATIIGALLAIINYARLLIYFALRFAITEGQESDFTEVGINEYMAIAAKTGLGISISLFVSIVFSKMIGTSLPIFALKIKVDPASMASPMLTTIIDTITTTLLFLVGIAFISLG